MSVVSPARVYVNPIISADADGLNFVANGELHVIQLSELALQQLARQIDAALKDKSARVQKP